MKLPAWKVDWPNHLIGFFSALFGILIAFELDQWREAKTNEEDALNAFDKIKQEIQINKAALHGVVNGNLQLLAVLESELIPTINDKLGYQGSAKAALQINSKVHPIARIEIIDSVSSQINTAVTIHMGSLSHPTLHTSAWESAKATGIINHLEYEKVLTISYLYNIDRILEELREIRILLRKSDEINSKAGLRTLLSELKESYAIIQIELANYDIFANMILDMG